MFNAKPENTDTVAWAGRFCYNIIGNGSEVGVKAITVALALTTRARAEYNRHTGNYELRVRHEDKTAAYAALRTMGLVS